MNHKRNNVITYFDWFFVCKQKTAGGNLYKDSRTKTRKQYSERISIIAFNTIILEYYKTIITFTSIIHNTYIYINL
jgi:hypothetical protein